MDTFSPTNFSRLLDSNRTLRRNRSHDDVDHEGSVASEEEEVTYEKWNPDVETVNINWKGWKRSEHPKLRRGVKPSSSKDGKLQKLSELSAKCVAMHIPFEMVEKFQPPVPEELQQRITFWSFPEWDDDICLYTCLANSNDDEFLRGEILFENGNVCDVIQIGFHLNATVSVNTGEKFSVSISFDRRRITSCICTCKAVPLWCCHIVAVCLLRIYNPEKVQLRPPISESLTRLNRDQLQKFSQYLVSSLPEQYLQTAQRLLDDLNSGQPLPINTVCGAPDSTAGASVNEYAMWCLDDHQLHLNVKKQMNRFGNVPPMVFSDVNMLTNNIPAIINEYNSMLRPLRIGEPDSLWNLLSIVRDMYKKNDRNALPLLEIITDEMTNCVQIILWWFANKSGLNGDCGYQIKYYYNGNSNSYVYQASAARLCDEIISLWRLAALNPALNPKERMSLRWKFKDWHFKIIDLIWNNWKHTPSAFDLFNFSGFKPCVDACKLNWQNFQLPGITYSGYTSKKDNSWMYDSHPFTLGIDIKKLNCVKHPSETLLIALQTCYLHVERIRHSVSRVLNESAAVSSEGPDHRTIKFFKEHFSTSRDEVYRSVAHLITLVDSWVNDDCDDFEMHGTLSSSSADVSIANDKAGANSRSSPSCVLSDLQEKKLAIERQINNELRSRMILSPVSSWNGRTAREFSPFNDKFDDPYLPHNLEWEVYDLIMQDYDDDGFVASSSHSSSINSQTFFDMRKNTPWSLNGTHNAIFENFFDMDDVWQSLISRAEGLWAFGHVKEASFIVRKVAQHIIDNPPDQKIMCTGAFVKPKRRKGQNVINPIAHRLTLMAVERMEMYKFLLKILSSTRENYDIAFKIGLLGLELPRTPASIKPLEVKLFHLENEIADLLRKIPLTTEQFKILRTKLEKLKTGTYKTRGYKLLPNALTSYILDVTMVTSPDGKSRTVSKEINESLCFEAALSSLSLKPDVCEYEHSLLVEGLRRQRCDLALRMLDLYKDEPKKVYKIMDVLIDQEIDPNMKRPLHLWYYQEKSKQEERLKIIIEKSNKKRRKKPKHFSGTALSLPPQTQPASVQIHTPAGVQIQGSVQPPPVQINQPPPPSGPYTLPYNFSPNNPPPVCAGPGSVPTPNQVYPIHSRMVTPTAGPTPLTQPPNLVPNPSAVNNLQFPRTIATFNPIVPPGSINSYPPCSIMAPLQTAPPPGNRQIITSSVVESCSLPPKFASLIHPSYSPMMNLERPYSAPSGGYPRLPSQSVVGNPFPPLTQYPKPFPRPSLFPNICTKSTSRNTLMVQKINKSKCGKGSSKKLVGINYRNRSPDEALAHSMTELAKSVLFRSGGHLATSFYVHNHGTAYVKTPNHVLHMCALQLAMYGLGISNNASTAWESRTFSPHVTLLTSLAIDIGAPAIMFLVENWPGHLTPAEAINLAERAAGTENPIVRNLVARLALTCLKYADKLSSNEIILALNQGQTLSSPMQEKACCELEKVASSHKMPLDVLFFVSKLWYSLYAREDPDETEDGTCFRRLLPPISYCSIYRPPISFNGQTNTSTPVLNEIQMLQRRSYYLVKAYKVSLMAFQNIASEINEEKAHYRFQSLPSYASDVYRVLQIAKLLGDEWVQHFCMVVENTLVNPFLLYEIACGAAVHFAKVNPSGLHYHIATAVNNLINKCEAMFFLYLHNKLYNMSQYEEDEFINMARIAHKVFSVSPDGPYRYQEWLQSLRNADTPIRDLYMKIAKAIEEEEKSKELHLREESADFKGGSGGGSSSTCILPFHSESTKNYPIIGNSNDDDDDEDTEDDDDDDDEEAEESDDDDDDDEDESNDNENGPVAGGDRQNAISFPNKEPKNFSRRGNNGGSGSDSPGQDMPHNSR